MKGTKSYFWPPKISECIYCLVSDFAVSSSKLVEGRATVCALLSPIHCHHRLGVTGSTFFWMGGTIKQGHEGR